MAGYVRRRCPICGAAVGPHCRSTTCPWWRCPREACKAVLNFRRAHGLQYLHGGVIRSFNFVDLTDPGG